MARQTTKAAARTYKRRPAKSKRAEKRKVISIAKICVRHAKKLFEAVGKTEILPFDFVRSELKPQVEAEVNARTKRTSFSLRGDLLKSTLTGADHGIAIGNNMVWLLEESGYWPKDEQLKPKRRSSKATPTIRTTPRRG